MNRKKIFQITGLFISGIILVAVVVLGFLLFRYRQILQLGLTILSKEETSYLVFFQNSLELRPTGGFLGNFVELTFEDRSIKEYSIVNTNQFDEDSSNKGLEVPTGFQQLLPSVSSLQLRDSNWDPDFPTSAQLMMQLYKEQGGKKDIQGLITIDSHILPVLLEEIGPVYLESLGGEPVTSEDVLWRVQYDTNWGFFERGLERDNRKQALNELVVILEERVRSLPLRQKIRLGQRMIDLAERNHIMMYTKDERAQEILTKLSWDGAINQDAKYMFQLVDANLGGLKTDFFMERDVSLNYFKCEDGLCAEAKILYRNTAEVASILNDKYRSYTRVVLPEEAFVTEIIGVTNEQLIDYQIQHNRKLVGFEIDVPVNQFKEIILRYHQPIDNSNARLLLVKQPGVLKFNLKFQSPNSSQDMLIDRDQWLRI